MADDGVNVGPEPETDYEDPELTGNGPTTKVPLSAANCDEFTFVLYVFVLGGLCIFGLVGNTLAFLVLRSERRGHVATFLLQTMAVADNLFLTTTALSLMTMELTMHVDAAAAASAPSAEIDQRHLTNLYTITAYVQVRRPPASPLALTWCESWRQRLEAFGDGNLDCILGASGWVSKLICIAETRRI